MLRASIAFFILALVAMVFGASGVAGMSMEIGRILIVVFLVLAVVSFLINLLSGRKTNISGFVWALLIPSAFMLGCSSAKKHTDQALSTPSAETQTAARQAGAAQVVEINFAKGSAVLTEGSRVALRNMVAEAKNAGPIDDLKILAWSDNAYPAPQSNGSLSQADRNLADQRSKSISEYVKEELAIDDVDTYNMAERPNALDNFLNTSDAEIKGAFENAGVVSADGKSLTGKASRAVVMAIPEK